MDGGKLMDEMDTLLNAASADADAAELPFESIDDFSTEPVSFEEMCGRMLERVEMIFDLSTVYNRQSAEYLQTCALLERGIKYLAGCCITKAALEENKVPMPSLGQLSLEKLYGMASFNFRKLDTAVTEQIRKFGRKYSPELLDMEFRYFSLLSRLRATQKKKYNYFFNFYYCDKRNDETVTGKAFNGGYNCGPASEPPVFRRPSAFPMNRAEIIELRDGAENAGKVSLTKQKINRNVVLKNSGTDKEISDTPESQELLPEDQIAAEEKRFEDSADLKEKKNEQSWMEPEAAANPSQKKGVEKGPRVTEQELQQEFDEGMQQVWANFTRRLAEERKGSSPP